MTATLIRGDDRILDVVAKMPPPDDEPDMPFEDRDPFDLTGLDLWWTAKYRQPHGWTDPDAKAVFGPKTIGAGITVTNASGGLAEVRVTAADWAEYSGRGELIWDLQTKSVANQVVTIASGVIRVDVEADVTRATT